MVNDLTNLRTYLRAAGITLSEAFSLENSGVGSEIVRYVKHAKITEGGVLGVCSSYMRNIYKFLEKFPVEEDKLEAQHSFWETVWAAFKIGDIPLEDFLLIEGFTGGGGETRLLSLLKRRVAQEPKLIHLLYKFEEIQRKNMRYHHEGI